jgi:hypothetical protein
MQGFERYETRTFHDHQTDFLKFVHKTKKNVINAIVFEEKRNKTLMPKSLQLQRLPTQQLPVDQDV